MGKQWSEEKAKEWYEQRPWLVGCNFLPSTAVNSTEMWQEATFDEATIDRELGWAAGLGFNSIRVFVQYLVWEADPAGQKTRMERFLEIADRHGITVMFILFDDCFIPEPYLGKQAEPVPGVHNSQWTSSPGETRKKENCRPNLEKYVKDVVAHFGQDKRVVVWDLYNEAKPESRPLLEKVFEWARGVHPIQPLTSCWQASDLWDVASYHDYTNVPPEKFAEIAQSPRPTLCTEWMARTMGSRFELQLPYFRKYKIGCYSWGLVAGRTQTYFPWGSLKGAPEPKVWFHDVLRKDGTPFDPKEIEVIKKICRK